MFGFVLEHPDQLATIVKIGHYDSHDNAMRALHVYARDWAITKYGIDVATASVSPDAESTPSAPATSQIAVETIDGSVHIRRCTEERRVGYWSTTVSRVFTPIAQFRVIASECVGHSDHSKLVDRIADEAAGAARTLLALETETTSHRATQSRLADMTSRGQQSGAAFSELLAEYSAMQQEHLNAANERDWYALRLKNLEDRLSTTEKTLCRTKDKLETRKREFRAAMREMRARLASRPLRADANELTNDESTIDTNVVMATQHHPCEIPTSNLGAELLHELATNRPRLKTRQERDSLLNRGKY